MAAYYRRRRRDDVRARHTGIDDWTGRTAAGVVVRVETVLGYQQQQQQRRRQL